MGKKIIFIRGIYLLHFLKQRLTEFVNLVYWCGLEKRPCILTFFSMKCSTHVGYSPSGAKSGKTWCSQGYLMLCLLFELGSICISMAVSL